MASTGTIWQDGTLREAGARETTSLAAFSYGLVAFEGILCAEAFAAPRLPTPDCRGGCAHFAFRLTEHLRRLTESARFLGWEPPFSLAEMQQAVVELVRQAPPGSHYLRPLLFSRRPYTELALAADGAELSLLIQLTSFPLLSHVLQMNKGVRLAISRRYRIQGPRELCAAKLSGKYLPLLLAREEARQARRDDALLLDEEGRLAETSTANVFVVRGEAVLTPPPGRILPGITRDSVLRLAASLGLRPEERPITVDELLAADEVFLTSTAAGLRAVEEIDAGWRSRSQAVTQRLRQAYLGALSGTEAAWVTRI
jgi:branched-chain amino acid aminotransferase